MEKYDFRTFSEKRRNFAIDCKNLFQCHASPSHFVDEFSGAVLTQYTPRKGVSMEKLPVSVLSGPVLGEGFWTDGMLLLKTDMPPRETEVYVAFDKPIAPVLEKGERVHTGFIIFHDTLKDAPHLLLVYGNEWAVFNLASADFLVGFFRFGEVDSLEMWMNKSNTGCALYLAGEPLGFLSKMTLTDHSTARIQALLEKANAFHRS